jgi:hypothetical protein
VPRLCQRGAKIVQTRCQDCANELPRLCRLDPSYKLTRCCCTRRPQKARTCQGLPERAMRSAIWVTVMTTCRGGGAWAHCHDCFPDSRARMQMYRCTLWLWYRCTVSFCWIIKKFWLAFFNFCFSLFTFHFSPLFHFSLLVLGSAAKSAGFTLTARKGQREKRIERARYMILRPHLPLGTSPGCFH